MLQIVHGQIALRRAVARLRGVSLKCGEREREREKERESARARERERERESSMATHARERERESGLFEKPAGFL